MKQQLRFFQRCCLPEQTLAQPDQLVQMIRLQIAPQQKTLGIRTEELKEVAGTRKRFAARPAAACGS